MYVIFMVMVRIIKLCRILNAIYLSLHMFKQISGLMSGA